MSAPDVKISKQPGLGRRKPNDDYISGLVMGGVATIASATTAALALGDIVELKSTIDAKGYGLTPAYDTTNSVLVYHRIERYFKRNPNGTLFIMLVAQGTTLTAMCTKGNAYLKKMLATGNRKIKQAAVALNPLTNYVGTFNTGIDGDVTAAILKAQELAAEEFLLHRPIDILVEGFHFNGTATNAVDMRTKASGQVGVVIAADPAISALGDVRAYYAAVEDALGCVSAAKVNENIGWVGKFNLQELANSVFVTAGLSSGLSMDSYTDTDIDTLHDKGYIFCRYHSQKTGVYFNSAPTCTAADQDDAYLENSRTLNKGARVIRVAIIDDLNGPLVLNEDGTIRPEAIGALEAKAEAALSNMQKDGEISAFDVIVDPAQKPIDNSETTYMVYKMVPVGVNRMISGKISLVGSL